ncbi:MAG: hypothetical protein KME03_09145 [Aphanocapsa lilacina HA4352-LM1]|jgi:Zn-dependent metalloprotease|nr:hypothetical protein [Aphanocapsa lilacina HA4352-LM1]
MRISVLWQGLLASALLMPVLLPAQTVFAMAMVQVHFDDASGELKRISGDLGPAQTPEMLRTTIDKYRALFLDPEALTGLRFTRLSFIDNSEIYQFQQTYEGLEVFGSSLIVSVSNGRLKTLINDLRPNLQLDTRPGIEREEAERVARAALHSQKEQARTRLVVYARSEELAILAYAVAFDRSTVLVDARSARIIGVEPQFSSPA